VERFVVSFYGNALLSFVTTHEPYSGTLHSLKIVGQSQICGSLFHSKRFAESVKSKSIRMLSIILGWTWTSMSDIGKSTDSLERTTKTDEFFSLERYPLVILLNPVASSREANE
jgi:hypothetical protein